MRLFAFASATLLAAAPALACVCIDPASPEQKREVAARIAAQAIAVADVELASPMDHAAARGETYRVLQVHFGRAAERFELDRSFTRDPDGQMQMMMTSCDVVPQGNQPTTVVLYAAPSQGRLRIGGTCDHLFVNSPGAIQLIRAEAAKLERPAERG